MNFTPHRTRVAISVTNCICHDQRVMKMGEVISKLNCDITFIGREMGECCKNDLVPFRTKRFRMIFNKGFLFYKFFNLRLLFYLLLHKFDLLVSNDLDTLLPNFLISRLKGLPLVYDSHEYFTGVAELQTRPFIKWIWKLIEKKIFPYLHNIITVSDSIAAQYEVEYGKRPVTVRNCSLKADEIVPYSKKDLGVKSDDLLIILQGTGINIDRGSEELIEALGRLEGISLLIVGSGNIIDTLKNNVLRSGLSVRVKFIPKVSWREMMRYTRSADAGVSLDKETCINHRFSLPNKLFDYLSAGIPVIASDLPEMSRLIKEYGFGITIRQVSPDSIAESISFLRKNPDKLAALKRSAVEASKHLNWDTEKEKATEFFKNVLVGLPAGAGSEGVRPIKFRTAERFHQ
jgi:glycosyltransferase involved in cell wall biosynthesis